MFKVGKLANVCEEKIKVDYIELEISNVKFKTLTFCVSGIFNQNEVSFSFDLNCKPDKLLNIEFNETSDFSNYILDGTTIFNINGVAYIETKREMKINRYKEKGFIINVNFINDYNSFDENIFSGVLEFELNLDDYL